MGRCVWNWPECLIGCEKKKNFTNCFDKGRRYEVMLKGSALWLLNAIEFVKKHIYKDDEIENVCRLSKGTAN